MICCYISPTSVLTRYRLNQCADDITCQSTSYFIIFFAQINFRIHHVFRGTITHYPNFVPYLLGFFGIHCQNPHLPLKGSNCSSMRTAEPTKYNDLYKPINLSQISRNATILSSKRHSVLVALSSNLTTDKRRLIIMFSLRARATLGDVLLQVKSLPWKTLFSWSALSPVSECSTSVFSGSPWSPVSATSYVESILSSICSSTASSSSSEPHSPISSLLCLSSSLSSLSQSRRLIS